MEEVVTPKKVNPYIVALSVLLPSFLSLAASSATNVSQPHIAGFYGATQYETNTVITCYIISGGLMLPVTGYLVRTIGKKLLMYYSIWIFCLGCLLCLLAPNLQALIAARIIQGIGSGCILPLCQAILLEVFPEEQRGVAMGLFGVAAMFSPLAGPFMGGYLTDNYSWQWIFIMNIPLCMLSFLLVKLFVPSDKPEKQKYNKRFDMVGYVSVVVAMACMQIVLDKGQQFNWFDTPWICWLTGISIFSFVFFYVWELEYKYPIIDIRVFKDKNFAIGTVLHFVIGAVLYSTLAILPLFLQQLMGYTATLSGLAISPRGFGSLAGLIICAVLANRVDQRWVMAVGMLILAFSNILFGTLNLQIAMGNIILPNIICGAAFSVVMIPLMTIAFVTLKNNQMTNATGVFNLAKSVGGAIGTSAVSTMVSRMSQVHQTHLIRNLTYSHPGFTEKLGALQSGIATMSGHALSAAKANVVVYKQLVQQSTLMAYMDCFKIYAALLVILTPMIFLFQKVKYKKNKQQKAENPSA